MHAWLCTSVVNSSNQDLVKHCACGEESFLLSSLPARA